MAKISHVMPVRDGGVFLKRALEAIQANLMGDDEIVLIDDGSSDNTLSIFRNFSKSQERVKIIRTKGVGLPIALNLAIRECDYDWVARYDVDDSYSYNRIYHQRLAIQRNPSLVACFSDYSIHLDGERFAGFIPSPIFHHATLLSLTYSQQTAHPSVVFNKSAFNSAGQYRHEDFPSEDLSLWLRLGKLGDLSSVGEELVKYRLSTESVSALRRNDAKRKTQELLKSIGVDKKTISYARENLISTLDAYTVHKFSTERQLLFIRNLRQASKLFAGATDSRNSVFDYARIKPWSLSKSALTLAYFEVMRDSYRSGKLATVSTSN